MPLAPRGNGQLVRRQPRLQILVLGHADRVLAPEAGEFGAQRRVIRFQGIPLLARLRGQHARGSCRHDPVTVTAALSTKWGRRSKVETAPRLGGLRGQLYVRRRFVGR